jgi:hypothetical protein
LNDFVIRVVASITNQSRGGNHARESTPGRDNPGPGSWARIGGVPDQHQQNLDANLNGRILPSVLGTIVQPAVTAARQVALRGRETSEAA